MSNPEEYWRDTSHGKEWISRKTTELYTFQGESEIGWHHVFDHVINFEYKDDEDEDSEVESFWYVFKYNPRTMELNEDYVELAAHIFTHKFVQHRNLREPVNLDLMAFDTLAGFTEDELTIPEAWEQPLEEGKGSE